MIGVFGTDTILYVASEPNMTHAVFAEVVETVTYEREIPENLSNACYCVTWLRESEGIPIRGDAQTIIPNVDRPYVGGVVLLTFNDGTPHAAKILFRISEKVIWIRQANKVKCQVTEEALDLSDPRIRGYWFRNLNLVQ